MATHTTRREVLKAMPAAGAATLFPIAASAAADRVDPHPAWLAEWRARRDAYNAPDPKPDPRTEQIEAQDELDWQQITEIVRLLTFTPATTIAGAAAQLEYAIEDFGPHIFGTIRDDVDEVTFRSVLETLRRLT